MGVVVATSRQKSRGVRYHVLALMTSVFNSHNEVRLAGIVVGAGLALAARAVAGPIATNGAESLRMLMITHGPIELVGLGVVLWLHARWRRSLG